MKSYSDLFSPMKDIDSLFEPFCETSFLVESTFQIDTSESPQEQLRNMLYKASNDMRKALFVEFLEEEYIKIIKNNLYGTTHSEVLNSILNSIGHGDRKAILDNPKKLKEVAWKYFNHDYGEAKRTHNTSNRSFKMMWDVYEKLISGTIVHHLVEDYKKYIKFRSSLFKILKANNIKFRYGSSANSVSDYLEIFKGPNFRFSDHMPPDKLPNHETILFSDVKLGSGPIQGREVSDIAIVSMIKQKQTNNKTDRTWDRHG